jgi:hypothetical protein
VDLDICWSDRLCTEAHSDRKPINTVQKPDNIYCKKKAITENISCWCQEEGLYNQRPTCSLWDVIVQEVAS